MSADKQHAEKLSLATAILVNVLQGSQMAQTALEHSLPSQTL
jgi:hypothetical protein